LKPHEKEIILEVLRAVNRAEENSPHLSEEETEK
jgi:hypothetical protein